MQRHTRPTLAGVADHPLRDALTNEVHARPPVALRAPAQVSHLAVLSGEKAGDEECCHIAELCRRLGVAEPPEGAHYWHVGHGDLRLNWERHTEFSTYTFFHQGPFTEPFAEPVIVEIPADWLAGLMGDVLVAIHVALEPRDAPPQEMPGLAGLFASGNVAASRVVDGAAIACSDFRLGPDGFSRFLVRDAHLLEWQAGRLVQRLLEIETYRMMALLAFPSAQEYGTQVTQADRTLAEITDCMTRIGGLRDEHLLLARLSQLAAEVERIAAATNYRFGAARAYYALVQRRIDELRERRIEGWPTIKEFMERRLAPAMRTCESVQERVEILSKRVARTCNLLRTRVDVALESQNRDLLRSMNRRARLQLRLQHTVEGLSVVVLSYYLVGLVGYALKGGKAAGLPLDIELLTGFAIPFVVAAVWLGMRRVHHALGEDRGGHEDD